MLMLCALTAAGFGLTVLALYPGYLTNDATYVHSYIQDWQLGDWQSPLMTMLWWLIDPIAPGSGSMFLLIVTLYWLGFGLFALIVARRSAALACLVPLLALTPPAFILLSMIWRDILFSGVWLVAAALAYAVAERPARCAAHPGPRARPGRIRHPVAAECDRGAPLLIAYAIWPTRFEWKRIAIMFLPAVLAGYGLIHLVYYEILHVKRENPLHSLWSSISAASPISPGEPVSGDVERRGDGAADQPMLRAHALGLLLDARSLQVRDGAAGAARRRHFRHASGWSMPGCTRSPPIRSPICSHRATVLWTFLALPNLTLELFKLPLLDETPIAHNRYFMALLRCTKCCSRRCCTGSALAAACRRDHWLGLAGAPHAERGIRHQHRGLRHRLCHDLRRARGGDRFPLRLLVRGRRAGGRVPALIARREQRAGPRSTLRLPHEGWFSSKPREHAGRFRHHARDDGLAELRRKPPPDRR